MTTVAEILAGARARDERALSEHDSKKILASYGVPVVAEYLANDRDEALYAAHELGFPVVVKGCSAAVAHKSERGLVELGLADPSSVAAACERIRAKMGEGDFLVQQMVSGQRELIAGLIRDPQFGPCVSFGFGGIFAEAVGDMVFRVAPFDRSEALAMMDELRNVALLGRLRGLPEVDRAVLADILLTLGRLGLDHPEIGEIDINPLIVAGDKPIAVDALVVLS